MAQVIIVKSENYAADNSGCIISGKMPYKQKHGVGSEDKREEKYEIVGENGIFENKGDRKGKHSLRQKVFGITQGVGHGIKDIGIE